MVKTPAPAMHSQASLTFRSCRKTHAHATCAAAATTRGSSCFATDATCLSTRTAWGSPGRSRATGFAARARMTSPLTPKATRAGLRKRRLPPRAREHKGEERADERECACVRACVKSGNCQLNAECYDFPASAPLDGPVVERSGGALGHSSRRGRLEGGGGEGGGGEGGAAPQPRLSTRGREPPTCRCAARGPATPPAGAPARPTTLK